MKKRGFELVKRFANSNLKLPQRQTVLSAGYDLEAAEDFVVPSIWKKNFLVILQNIFLGKDEKIDNKILKPVLVPTGVKAYMQKNEVLLLINRSSGPLKRRLILPNGIGVIDADYYGNEDNDGEIFVQLINYGLTDYHIKKGERIAQGIFTSYLLTDNEKEPDKKRTGGFGSSDN